MNTYTTYGYRKPNNNQSEISYNGDYEIDGLFLMGNGYRLYSPTLRRFYSPDSLSPGEAGVNPYTYNLGDPINRSDPSGHLSIGEWIGVGLAILGVLVSIASLGLGAAAGAGMISLGAGSFLSTVAATGIASVACETIGLASGVVGIAATFSSNEKFKKFAEIFDYVSLAFAVVPVIVKGVSKSVAKSAARINNRIVNVGNDLSHASVSSVDEADDIFQEEVKRLNNIGVEQSDMSLTDIENLKNKTFVVNGKEIKGYVGRGAYGHVYTDGEFAYKVEKRIEKFNDPFRITRISNEHHAIYNPELMPNNVLRTTDNHYVLKSQYLQESTPAVQPGSAMSILNVRKFVAKIENETGRFLCDCGVIGNVLEYNNKYVIVDFDHFRHRRNPSFTFG